MEPTERTQTRPDGTTFTPKFVDGMEYLQQWRRENIYEYDQVVAHQKRLDEEAPSQSTANESHDGETNSSNEQFHVRENRARE